MDFLRNCCIARLHRIQNEEIRNRVGADLNIPNDISERRFMWYGYILRMDDIHCPFKMFKYSSEKRQRHGRAKKLSREGQGGYDG